MITTSRPFEFRAFHRPTKRLFDVVIFGPTYIFAKDTLIPYLIGECVLMQFTGLYDSQGKKVFEGDVLYSFCPGRGNVFPVSTEYWRVVAYYAGGFCELAKIDDDPTQVDTIFFSDSNAVQNGEWLDDTVVDCYYLRPDLLELNTETAEVPASFD